MRTITPRTQRYTPRLANDRRWTAAAHAWLQQYPICVLCLVHGKINDGAITNPLERQRSLVVDHIEPHRGSLSLFWDQSNWETLCRFPCHDVDKQRHEQRGGTAEAWLAYLASEVKRTDSRNMVIEMERCIPEWMRRLVDV